MCPGETGSLSSPGRAWLDWFDWFYLPRGYLNLFRRVVGALMLATGLEACVRATSLSPYFVPLWGAGLSFVELPSTPLVIDVVAWGVYFAGAIYLLLGGRALLPVALSAAVLAFYASREQWVIVSHYMVMLSCYLMALLFDRGEVNCARRLVQLSVACCYFYAAVNKLHPVFLSGQSLAGIVENGWSVRDILIPAVSAWHPGGTVLVSMSVGVILAELFLAAGMFFARTRAAAVLTGLVFHGVISVFSAGIEIFAPMMWCGYLAFFEKTDGQGRGAPSGLSRQHALQTAGACLMTAFLILMPVRFFLTGKDWTQIVGFDRSPWSFAMFLGQESFEYAGARWRAAGGIWVPVPLAGRMAHLSGDVELLSLSKYILKEHPPAAEVEVESRFLANREARVRKTISLRRTGSAESAAITTSIEPFVYPLKVNR